MLLHGGDLWAQFPAENMLRRVDVSSGRITAEVRLDSAMSNVLAATPESVWTVIGNGGVLVRVDARTGTIAARVTLGAGGGRLHPLGLGAAGDGVFVAVMDRHRVVEVNAAGEVTRGWDLPWPPCGVVPAADATVLWVYTCDDGRLARFDLTRGAVTLVVMVDDLVGAVMPVGDGLWITLARGRAATHLVHVNAAGVGDDAIDLGGGLRLAAWRASGALWVGSPTGLVRYSPDPVNR
jgi:hypothetical protein